jgi:hypothetical protein
MVKVWILFISIFLKSDITKSTLYKLYVNPNQTPL